jgi:hypothetical protein
MQVGLHSCCSCPACLFTCRVLAFDNSPTDALKVFVQLHHHHNRFANRYFRVQKMSASTTENLPPEILLQMCELLRDTHRASNHNFSRTSRKIRRVAAMHLFQEVRLQIRSHDSVGESVQQLSDALGPISALPYIRKLKLSNLWIPTTEKKFAILRIDFVAILRSRRSSGHTIMYGNL